MAATYRTSAETSAIRDDVRARAEATRGGVFRRADLSAWGVDSAVIPVMLRQQWWARLHHGVYVDRRTLEAATSPVDHHRLRAAASVFAIAGPAYLFAVSAAQRHGLPFDRATLGQVHIIRPLGRDSRALRRRVTGIDRLTPAVVHQHTLTSEDLVELEGVPSVNRPLAAVSAASMASLEWAVVTLDAAAWQSPETMEQLGGLADEWGRLRGIGTVRAAMPWVRTGAQTPLESLSRVRLVQGGLPEPRLQVPLYDADGLIGYVDMLWEDLGVVGEADGAVKYLSGTVLLDEKRREDRIRALGLAVVRWSWDDIMREPTKVAARIRAAAHAGRRYAL